jgi:shikimate kinase
MDPLPSLPVALVVVAGPQASGKSTVAAALCADLRRDGEQVALVELDQIAGMARPTLPDWETAHRIFESVTGHWLRADLTCVIAEGSGSHAEVVRLIEQAPATAVVVTVVATVPFEFALGRAQADPTRGISRERDFLAAVYQRWSGELARFDHDVLLDTSEVGVEQSVETIRAAVGRARQERAAHDSTHRVVDPPA